MNRTLITGANGFIGRRLMCNACRGLVRRPSGFADEVVGDLGDSRTLHKACSGIDTVFHCAGHAHAFSAGESQVHWQVNYQGTRDLLTAAGRSGVRRFVFLSSVKAMADPGDQCVDEDWPGRPETAYGQAKRAAEEAVLEAGQRFDMQVVNLRLAMVYGRGGRGNLERMAAALRAGWFPKLPETGNRRSLVHVDDVVDVARLVAARSETAGRTFIVAEPRAYSGRELCEAIVQVLGSPRPPWTVPAPVLRFGGRLGDLIGRLARRPFPLNSDVVTRLLDSACYSPSCIHNALGWRAEIGLLDGLRETLSSASDVR